MSRSWLLKLPLVVCSALALAWSGTARPGAHAAPVAAAGLGAHDWAGIRAAYEAGRRAAFEVEGGYVARNPGQGFLARFDGRGFSTEPDQGGWTWGLELLRYGFLGAEREVAEPARVSAGGQRVAYEWDADLEEWYLNDGRGLEHGYTVGSRPPQAGPDASAPLTLTLGVRGGLQPEVDTDGRGVRFLDADGAAQLSYDGLVVADAAGRALPAHLDARGATLRLSIDDRGARYPLTVDPVVQLVYIKASNNQENGNFGFSVAISGDTAVVGAIGEASAATGVNGLQSDTSAPFAGAAYVFVRSGTTWSQQAYLKASNTEAGDLFGASVAISGDTIIVGAQNESSSATGVNGDQFADFSGASGAAYVFVRSGTTWSQQAYVKASNTESIDHFGWSVALSGNTAAVGAISEDSAATGIDGNQASNGALNSGAVYVFARAGTSWSQQAYVKASNTETTDDFGVSVTLSGNTLVVGADEEDSLAAGVNGDQLNNAGVGTGAAYVYVRNGSSWSQQAYLKASNPGAFVETVDNGDHLGSAVAMSGETLVVSALGEDSKATGLNGDQTDNSSKSSGAVYIFVRSGSTWSQQGYLKSSNTGAGDAFGFSLALSGNTLVVGATGEDSSATGINGTQTVNDKGNSGAAYLFTRSGVVWAQQAYIKASNTGSADFFGFGVAVDGDALLVSAQDEDSDATGLNGDQSNNLAPHAGAAYAFDLGLDAWTDLGLGLLGSNGMPLLVGTGPLSAGSSNQFALSHAKPSATAFLVVGFTQLNAPFKGGTMVPQPYQAVVFGTNGAGQLTIPFGFPAGIPVGSAMYFQFWIADPGAVAGFAASNGLKGVSA
jgi:hypothetical protein